MPNLQETLEKQKMLLKTYLSF